MISSAPRGRLLVVSAPSGAGKTSLVSALREQRPTLGLSISHTTRAPRPHDVDGREYFFVAVERFMALLAEGAFLEHAGVFDHDYGAGRARLNATLDTGRDIIGPHWNDCCATARGPRLPVSGWKSWGRAMTVSGAMSASAIPYTHRRGDHAATADTACAGTA